MSGFVFKGSVLTGCVSRSQETVVAHRSLRDGYGREEEFKNAIERDRQLIVERQKKFAFVSGGQADWLDLLRPIASTFRGFVKRSSSREDAVGPVTRWFRTNTFYRKPLVGEEIDCDGTELSQYLPAVENGVVFFLGPYSFTRLVENSFYSSERELAIAYCKALAKNMPALKQKGYSCVLLLEPSIGFELSKNSFSKPKWLSQAVDEFKSVSFGIHFPLADAGKILDCVEDSRASFVGIDCIYTPRPGEVKTKKSLLLGVVDAARASVEDASAMQKHAKLFLENAEFSGEYYVGANNRLYDVPFQTALAKINVLSSFSPW